ncbi:MAG: hypothetical protein KAV87_13645 [Desulfobacteraceae bacterium]|nr:hypothetical protein [Desulfobacteraceae bacterium]
MRISAARRTELYSAIHDAIIKTRIEMKLPANQDGVPDFERQPCCGRIKPGHRTDCITQEEKEKS